MKDTEYTKARLLKTTNVRLTDRAHRLSKKVKRRITKVQMLDDLSKTPI